MRKLLLLALICIASTAHGQSGVRVTSQVSQQGTVANATNVVILPAGARIRFCNAPANAVPCTNLATTYTDATLATPCSTSTQIVLDGTNTCVANVDAQNNWGVWVASGQYAYTITLANGANTGPYFVTAGGSGGGAGNPAAPGAAVQFANAPVTAFATTGCSSSSIGIDSLTSPTVLIDPCSLAVGGPRPYIDVTAPQYGAKGDGSTDDSAAIQAAINAACALKSSSTGIPQLLFPPGTYGLLQPQLPSTASPLTVPCSLRLTGTGGAVPQFSTRPIASLSVGAGANPNAAPAITISTGTGATIIGVTIEDLLVDGYNEAIGIYQGGNIQLQDSFFRAHVTGMADNTPIYEQNSLWTFMNGGGIGFNNPTPSTFKNLYDVEMVGTTNASGDITYLQFFNNVTMFGGGFLYDQRAVPNNGEPSQFDFNNVSVEDGANSLFTVTSTGGGPIVLNGVSFQHVQIQDQLNTSPQSVFNFNVAGGAASGISILQSGGTEYAIQQINGVVKGFNINGCSQLCGNLAVDASGNPIGGGTSMSLNGYDFFTTTADQERFNTDFINPAFSAALLDGPPVRLFPDGANSFATIALDPTGALFSTGSQHGWTGRVAQTVQNTIDFSFSTMLPPTGVTATPVSGGTLTNGTYYYFVSPTVGAGSCVNIYTGAPSLTAAATTTTGNNQVTISWTLPAVSSATLTGFCVFRSPTNTVIGSQTGISVPGSTSTTVTDTGSNFGIVGSGFEYNQMQAFHRITPFALDINGRINSHADTGTANAIVITTPLTMTSIPNGTPMNILVANNNTGATTINLDGIGATAATKNNGAALASGDLCANHQYSFIFNGSTWDLTSPSCTAPISGVSSFTGDGTVLSNSGSTGAVTATLATQSAHTVLAGPSSGSAAAPTFQTAPTIAVTNMTGTGAFNTSGNAGTATSAATLGACLEANPGDICYYTGSAWAVLTGNASGTQYLQETSSGVPSWTVPSGAGTVTHTSGALTSGQPVLGNGSADVKVGPINLAGGSSFVTGGLPNANLANPATTVNSQACTLGSTCTIPFQNNGSGASSQAGINLVTSTVNSVGLTVTPTNSSGIIEKFEVTGSSYTGNAATATALAATPSLCSAGQAPTGILANGNATGCSAGSGTVNLALQYSTGYYSAAGSANTLSGIAAPTTPGLWLYGYNTPSTSAVIPSVFLAGITPRDVTGTTSTDTIVAGDSSNCVFYEGSVAVAVTLPTPTTLANPHFVMCVVNRTTGSTTAVTFTSSGGLTINGTSTYVLAQGQASRFTVDASGSWESDGFEPQLTAGTNITFGRSAYGLTINATSGGTVNSGTATHLAYYASSTTAVSDMGADFTFSTHTLTGGASSILDLSAASSTAGFKIPVGAGAVPTADGAISLNSTNHSLAVGSNGTTLVMAVANTGTGASTTCGSHTWFNVISSVAVPTCTQPAITDISGLGTGVATFLATPTSANLAAALTDETGTGAAVFANTPTLVTPVLGAATATSLLATGIVDGVAPITITTGTTANLGATYNSGYTLNHEATAGTGVTYTLPATATGKQYCVKNSGTTGVVNTGVLTVYPPSSSFVILNGVVNTVGGGGTHGVASSGAAGDGACFVAIDATHWEVFVQSGTWVEN